MSDYPLESTWAEVDAAAQAVKNGLPKANLSGAVQASLDKADGAVQAGQQRAATDWDTEEAGIDENGKIVTRPSFSDEAKYSLLNLLSKVAYWTIPNAVALCADLEDKLFPTRHLLSITAAYDQDRPIYDNSSLDLVKLDLVVTANYSDGTSETLADDAYTLSGTLVAGQTCEITVSYGGKTATINVVVMSLPGEYQAVEYIEATGTQYIVLDDNFGTIAGRLTVDMKCSIESWSNTQVFLGTCDQIGQWIGRSANKNVGFGSTTVFTSIDGANFNQYHIEFGSTKATATSGSETIEKTYSNLTSGKLAIFAGYQSNNFAYFCKAKLKTLSANVDGASAYNLIPCYRKSDNVIGLYNTVTSTFLTNAGTGTFLKGGDI